MYFEKYDISDVYKKIEGCGLSVAENMSGNMGSLIKESYSNPRRKYHNNKHIANVLSVIDEKEQLNDILFLSAVFHDVIYEIGEEKHESNEVASANFFLLSTGSDVVVTEDNIEMIHTALDEKRIDIVKCILNTRYSPYSEQFKTMDENSKRLVLADWDIFTSKEKYDEYYPKVKAECLAYGIDEETYRTKRLQFLTSVYNNKNVSKETKGFISAELLDFYELTPTEKQEKIRGGVIL